MVVLINRTITFLTSPLAVSMGLLVVGLVLAWRWRRIGLGVMGSGLVWLYVMSTGAMYWVLGLGLEREFPPARVETLPIADAVVVLGGGVGGNTNTVCYTELFGAADRVVQAARIWKAGKAPVVITSGSGEMYASLPLLKELGVPESAVLVENAARNTEENARFVVDYVKARHLSPPLQGQPSQPVTEDSRQPTADSTNDGRRLTTLSTSQPSQLQTSNLKPETSNLKPQTSNSLPRILLVTSAWHMRRSLLMFRKYAPGVEVVPAACDYEATIWSDRFKLTAFLPDAMSLLSNSYMLKEYVGYWGYRLLR